MMKLSTLAIALALGLAPLAQAQVLDADVGVDVGAGTGSAQVDVSADANTDAGTDTESGAAAESTAEIVVDSGLNFRFGREDLDESTEYTVVAADSVRSAAALESYAAATVRNDARVESLALEDNRFEMAYRKPARFLWIIPASMTIRAETDAEGNVSVDYPWYSFLMSTGESRADLEARLAAEIEVLQNDTASAAVAATTTTTARTGIGRDPEIGYWARVMDRTYTALAGQATVS